MKKTVLAIAVLVLILAASCGNPLYPFKADSRYAFEGTWVYISGSGAPPEFLHITKDRFEFRDNSSFFISKIDRWKPYTPSSPPPLFPGYNSGYHLYVTDINGLSSGGDIYLLTDGESIMYETSVGSGTFNGPFFKQ